MIAKDAVDKKYEPSQLACTGEFLDRLLCPWQHLCGKAPEEVTDKAFELAAEKFLDAKTITEIYAKDIDISKAIISSIMEDKGLTKMKGFGVTATSFEQHRTTGDHATARRILSGDVYDKVFTQSVIKVLRIEKSR
jgi:hypothetical protein